MFLARSPNRVQALQALATGAHDRTELQAATGVPRPSVGRIITQFEARGWVRSDGRRYRLTSLGESFTAEFTSLVETTTTLQKLQPVIEWLPIEEFDFSLDCFADATIVVPERGDPTAPVELATEMTQEAGEIRFISDVFVPTVYEAVWRRAVHKKQPAEAVITTEVLDTIRRRPQTVTRTRETLASGYVTFYHYEGSCRYRMAVIDDTVAGIMVLDDEENVRGVIKTQNEAIRFWVESTIDTYQADAKPLDPDDLLS